MLIDVDGRDAYAYTGGRRFDQTLPVVVMIHGTQHDHSVWALQSRHLAYHGRAVLAVDLPGHGRSAGPPLATIEAMADWTLALLRSLKVPRASLIGHSMGSLIALEAAARAPRDDRASPHPARVVVERIALVATAYPMTVSALLLDAAAHDEARAFEMIGIWSSDARHGGYSHKPSAPAPGFGIVWGGRRLMERQPRGVLLNDLSACNAYRGGEAAAAALRCPALFIVGESDRMTTARSGKAFAATVAGARIVALPACGHLPIAEAPDATLEALDAFLG